MSFQVLAFGLWSAGSAQVDGSGQSLKAIFATAFVFGMVGLGVAAIGALRNWRAILKPSKLRNRAKTLSSCISVVSSVLARFRKIGRAHV